MTFRFADSFDHYSTTAEKKWGTSSSAVTVGSAYGRHGSQGAAPSAIQSLITVMDAQAGWLVGTAYRVPSLPDPSGMIIGFNRTNSSGQVSLRLDIDYTLIVQNENGDILGHPINILSVDTWYYIELKVGISQTSGSFDLHLDGTSISSATGVDTNPFIRANPNRIVLYGSTTPNFDDVYILDGVAPDNDFWGNVTVTPYYPASDGTYLQWATSSGSVHYSLVDDFGPDLADYIVLSSGSHGKTDTYLMQTVTSGSTSGSSVKAVQQVFWSDSDDGTFSDVLRGVVVSSGSQFQSADLPIQNLNPVAYMGRWSTNPATGSAWTDATINSSEFGVYRT